MNIDSKLEPQAHGFNRGRLHPKAKCCINCYFCSRTFQEIPVTYLCFHDILKRHKTEPVIVSEDYLCEHFIHNEEVE